MNSDLVRLAATAGINCVSIDAYKQKTFVLAYLITVFLTRGES